MRAVVCFVAVLAISMAVCPVLAHLPDDTPGYTGSGYCSDNVNCAQASVRKITFAWKVWAATEKGYEQPLTVCKGDVVEFKWEGNHDLVVATSAKDPCATGKSRLAQPAVGTKAKPATHELKTANVKTGTYPVISSVGKDCVDGKQHMLLHIRDC